MERSENVILTNMCMVCDGPNVLVEEKICSDYKGIVFPGGHVEPHEPIVDSVIREIYEETGLTIANPQLCGIKDWIMEDGRRYIVFLFRTDAYSGKLQSSAEGEVFWTALDTLTELPIMWHMDDMLRIFSTGEFAELYLDAEHHLQPILK